MSDPDRIKKDRPVIQSVAIVLVVLATLGGVIALIGPNQNADAGCASGNLNPSDTGVQLDKDSKKTFDLEFAKTASQQELGLSDRPCIPTNAAMLFLFASDDRFGIWMKDMRFPIDVVWLNQDKKIVTVEKNMLPSSYPKVYYPTEDARYVLEFNTGTVDSLQAHVGSQLNW